MSMNLVPRWRALALSVGVAAFLPSLPAGRTPAPQDSAAAIRLPVAVTVDQLLQPVDGRVLFDVRAAWEWHDWHVPGSLNVGLDAVLAKVDALPEKAQIVLLSRDGEVAFAVGGALLQARSSRAVLVLRGGVAAYYRQVVAKAGAIDEAGAAMVRRPPAGSSPTTRKRSAGC